MRKIFKEILEYILITLLLVFAFGVGAYYDDWYYNEVYGTTETTEIDYGTNIGA